MSIFQTPRPNDPNAALDKLVDLKNNRKSNLAALHESADINRKAEETKKQLEKADADDLAKKTSNKVLESMEAKRTEQLKNKTIATLETRIMKEESPKLFNQIIFEMAYNAYWLDDALKEKADIHAMYESFNNIKTTVAEIVPVGEETQFIKNVKAAVNEACQKRAKEIVDECNDDKRFKTLSDMQNIDFSLSDDADIELDDDLSSLGKDEIEQLVKDKVLAVVQDEKKSSQKKQDAFKEVEDAITALDNNSATSEETPDDDVDSTGSTESLSGYQMMEARNLRKKLNRMTESTTLFGATMMHATKTINEQIATEGFQASTESIATAVFTDAVFTYTVLETLNTLELFKFDAVNTRKLIKKLQTM